MKDNFGDNFEPMIRGFEPIKTYKGNKMKDKIITFMDLSWPLKIVAIVVWAFIINFVISTILYFI
jgi:hypothetical protein